MINWLQEWTVPGAITANRLDAENHELASVTSVTCLSLSHKRDDTTTAHETNTFNGDHNPINI